MRSRGAELVKQKKEELQELEGGICHEAGATGATPTAAADEAKAVADQVVADEAAKAAAKKKQPFITLIGFASLELLWVKLVPASCET